MRFSGGIWRARITLEERALLLTEQAAHLRRASKVETPVAVELLRELGRAAGDGVVDAIHVIGQFCGAPTLPARLEGATFSEVAKQWTKGELARDWPDHVNAKDNVPDERRLKTLGAIDVNGIKFGDLPVSRITIDHVEGAMRQLPPGAKRPATRRHYAQVIARELGLAVYPLRLRQASPLPKGFLLKVGKPPAVPVLVPRRGRLADALQGRPARRAPLVWIHSREGMRVSEALSLRWRDVDLERGSVSLDRNKTDDARTWVLDPGVTRALAVVHERSKPAGDALVFPSPAGEAFEGDRLAEVLRARCQRAS